MKAVKINQLEIENVKRIKAVLLTPTANGLTIIGGNNDRYRPSKPERVGSVIPPRIKLTLSNGLVVERTGNNSALKVTDPTGTKAGQQLLNSFVEELALNLPKFMECSGKEKANTLLRIIGVGDKLAALEYQEKQLYNQRLTIGRIADQKAKFAKEMPFYGGVPDRPVSALELIQRQQAILAQNGENQRKRARAAQLAQKVEELTRKMELLTTELEAARADLAIAQTSAEDLHDESTAQIEQDLREIEQINIKVRANLDREKAEEEAEAYANQYNSMTEELEQTRKAKMELLNGAQLPLEGLSVEDGELTYHGAKWDAMSGSDQLRVSTAIVRALNPNCGFVLLDKLEQMDLNTLEHFGIWLEEQGLQAIATRVSTGEECSVIIEDGENTVPAKSEKSWKDGF